MIDFPAYQLGMSREAVALVPHSSRWAEAFSLLSSRIQAALEGSGLELHHIGSTAIPGIQAKPILDLLGVVPELAVFDVFRSRLEDLGFTWKGEYGIPGRRYSVLYDAEGKLGFVHLHVFEAGHAEVARHLKFRDQLCVDPLLAREYDELKTQLQKKFAGERSKYTEAKASFIQGVLEKR